MTAEQNKSRLYVNVVGCITMFALGMMMTSNASVFTAICKEYGMPVLNVGVLASIYMFGFLVASVIGGEICEHIGKKKTILLACFLSMLGMLTMAYIPNMIICEIGLFLMGCGSGILEAQSTATLADSNADATRIMNISVSCYSVGALLSPLVIVAYLEDSGSWHVVYTCTAVIYLAVAILNSFLKLDAASAGKNISASEEAAGNIADSSASKKIVTITLLKNFSFIIVLMLVLLYMGLETNINFWTQTMFANAQYAAFALSMFWGIMIVGRVGGAIFSKGKKRHIFFLFTLILGLIGIIGMLVSQNDTVKLIFCGIVGISYGPIWPCAFAMGTDMNPKNTGAASGLIILAAGVGGALIPLLAGELSGAFGSIAVYGLCIVMLLAMIALYLILLQREKKHQTLF